uniref:Uncharacterized protein n=1 Tax=Sphaerodactylus townsendi TaxID=933632 RepID=A0ACB8G1L1_9SAUR
MSEFLFAFLTISGLFPIAKILAVGPDGEVAQTYSELPQPSCPGRMALARLATAGIPAGRDREQHRIELPYLLDQLVIWLSKIKLVLSVKNKSTSVYLLQCLTGHKEKQLLLCNDVWDKVAMSG